MLGAAARRGRMPKDYGMAGFQVFDPPTYLQYSWLYEANSAEIWSQTPGPRFCSTFSGAVETRLLFGGLCKNALDS